MRLRSILLVLILLGTGLAGCTTPGDDPGDGSDDADAVDGQDDDAGTGGAQDPSPDDPEDPPRTRGPPPKEQQVDDPSDIKEPGQYAFLPRADDAKEVSWDVPDWTTGDTWHWESHAPGAAAATPGGKVSETKHRVTGAGTNWEIPIHHISQTTYDHEGKERRTDPLEYTQGHLTKLEEDGYIEHVFLFPLEDGKRWVYGTGDRSGDLTKVTAEVRHDPDHLWQGASIEAWSVHLVYDGDNGVEMRYWVGVDQKNYVKRELWGEGEGGAMVMYLSTTLTSYTPG